jgi:hypothetical protein
MVLHSTQLLYSIQFNRILALLTLSLTTTMTAPDPSEGERPASSDCVGQVRRHDGGEATSLPQEEHRHDLVTLLPVVIYRRRHLS